MDSFEAKIQFLVCLLLEGMALQADIEAMKARNIQTLNAHVGSTEYCPFEFQEKAQAIRRLSKLARRADDE